MLRRFFLASATLLSWTTLPAAESATPTKSIAPAAKSPAAPAANSAKTLANTDNSSKESVDAEIVLLAGLPLTKGTEATLSYARQTYIKSDLIQDDVLRQAVRTALAKIEDHPENAGILKEEHLTAVGEYFLGQAMEAQKANKIQESLRLAQISSRISPGNNKAKLLLANILHSNYGRTDEAIATLSNGLEFLNVNDPLGRDYLERYFQFLQLKERDLEVINQSLKILQNSKDLPSNTKLTVSLAAATSLYWVGRYPECVSIININALDSQGNGLLLKARALFDGGKTAEAVALLEARTSDFSGATKDAIYSQQARFQLLLGKPKVALTVTNERIALDEKAPFPHLMRLQLLDRLELKDDYDKELQLIADRFADNSSTMLALANFAAERGFDGITASLADAATGRGFDRATFTALYLEALLNAKRPEQAIAMFESLNAADRNLFNSNLPVVRALVGIAYHARLKKDDAAAKSDRMIGDRYLQELIKANNLGPEAYRSVGRKLKDAHATEAAVHILEAGVKLFPRYSQLRAEYIGARILAGQTDAYGTRKTVADELEDLLMMRRPSPLIWHEALAWMRSEAKLSKEQAARLEKAIAPLARPDLDQKALAGR